MQCMNTAGTIIVNIDWSKNVACRKHGYKGKKNCYACEREADERSNKFWGWVIIILIVMWFFG